MKQEQPPTPRSGIVTLLTDFGLADEYVGVVKGMLLSRFSTASIVDICHTVGRQDVFHAVRILEASRPYFSAGTVHLVVVDPGVGTHRAILLVEACNQLFVGPDNGVFTGLYQADAECRCWRLRQDRAASSTFHGRDLMAPAAAKLAAGAAPEDLGEPVSPDDCASIALPAVTIKPGRVLGEVTGFDHFGNIATSIRREHLAGLGANMRVRIAGTTIDSLQRTYAEAVPGQLLALIDSRGYLEVAMNLGDAAEYLACRRGEQVIVEDSGGS